jgi:hypothetical protein
MPEFAASENDFPGNLAVCRPMAAGMRVPLRHSVVMLGCIGISLSGITPLMACHDTEAPVSRAECDAAMRHSIALRVHSSSLPHASPESQARHREQLAAAVGQSFVERCESSADQARYVCIMRATSAAELDECARRAPTMIEQGGSR